MEYERRKDTVIARITGELDHCNAPAVCRDLDRIIRDASVRQLVLDLSGMTFMDSSGIGVILGRYREMRARGGRVAVRGMNRHVEKIFFLSGMNQVIDII